MIRSVLPAIVIGLFSPAVASAAMARSDTAGSDSTSMASRVYFGGSIGLSVSGRITWFSVQPVVGYKFTPAVSSGMRAHYEYMSDRRSSPAVSWNNYGGSVFTRYRFHPQAFAQIEFEELRLDYGSGRDWVPFLLVGGGYVRRLGPKTSLVVEVLFDVLQDERGGPYRDQSPRVNVGIGVGF